MQVYAFNDSWVTIAWRETGGPPVAPPARRGFGSVFLARSVSHDLSGGVDFDFRPEGIACTITFPLSPEWADAGLPQEAEALPAVGAG